MKRYYLCDVVTAGGVKKSVAELHPGLKYVTVYMTNVPGGPSRPPINMALTLAAGPDHRALLSDPRIDPLPAAGKDAKMSSVSTPALAALKAALTRRGVKGLYVNEPNKGFRAQVRAVGRFLSPTFNEDQFDVREEGP